MIKLKKSNGVLWGLLDLKMNRLFKFMSLLKSGKGEKKLKEIDFKNSIFFPILLMQFN